MVRYRYSLTRIALNQILIFSRHFNSYKKSSRLGAPFRLKPIMHKLEI